MSRYSLEFTADAFKQNFRNLLEDLEGIATSLAGTVLLAGRSGGQQVAGGTAASEDLTLTSTANATKDRVYLGSAQTSAYKEDTDRLGIGTPSPSMDITIEKTVSGEVGLRVNNLSANAAADARVTAAMEANSVRIQQIAFSINSTATLSGVTMARWTTVSAINGDGLLVSTVPSSPFVFGTNNTERMRIDSNGNVEIGTAALATSATNGFLYIPSCAGTPTGVPTAKTGRVPLIYDTTNNKLYVYNGAWKSVTLA